MILIFVMLIQLWRPCEWCNGSGRATEFCPHCGQLHQTANKCLACGGRGGREEFSMGPDLTAPCWTPYSPPVWSPQGLPSGTHLRYPRSSTSGS